jgi:hypothetical protein
LKAVVAHTFTKEGEKRLNKCFLPVRKLMVTVSKDRKGELIVDFMQ